MQDYCNLLRENITSLTSYSRRWICRIEQQPLLSSYKTTKDVQLEIVRTPERHVELIKARVEKIEQIIATYTTEVEKMYPRALFGVTHKHYRMKATKNLFKAAYSSLSELSDKLKELQEQETRAKSALNDNDGQSQTRQQEILKDIREEIERIKPAYDREKESYRERATKIYQECRELEKERLDLIRKTLIKFIKAAFSFENVSAQRQIYEDLSSMLQNQQNTSEDLDFWARHYGVYDPTTSRSSLMSHTDDNRNERNSTQMASQRLERSQNFDTLSHTTTEIYVNESRIEHDEAESAE
ncbi:unnamed protein product [Rotaria sp. Silwood1]|nr:unnamed protein product [Rotaria sp. Silwood1]CAF1609405.1 unnamed protein product [Rotaria sp. Silwood1]CAF3522509.1 unnamed protein product [Rotaria sp. Silwood1]CAF3628934.1 unnamed protein product [Rotaria sp. Silwood1]CAF3715601.1 unnamed protein product [Rotaria sp. Silwood1]